MSEMTKEQVIARIQAIKDPMWTYQMMSEWYGIELCESAFDSLYIHMDSWVSRKKYNRIQNISIKLFEPTFKPNKIHRESFERFLRDRDLITLKNAAAYYATTSESFSELLRLVFYGNYITKNEYEGAFPGIYDKNFIYSLAKRLGINMVKDDEILDKYYLFFHDNIKELFGLTLAPLYCVGCKNDNSSNSDFFHYGNQFDIITNAPICSNYQNNNYQNNNGNILLNISKSKSIQCQMDACSIDTLKKYPEQIIPISFDPDIAKQIVYDIHNIEIDSALLTEVCDCLGKNIRDNVDMERQQKLIRKLKEIMKSNGEE